MSDEAKSWDELGGLDGAVEVDVDSSNDTSDDSPVLTQRKIRDLQKRDLQVIKQLVSDYPQFKSLPFGDQLDRLILVLETVCGFGAISEQTIQQFETILKFPNDSVLPHLNGATYSRGGVVKRRYREPFLGAYCLEREFKKILASEGSRSAQDEPIRKKVALKKEIAVQPVARSRPVPLHPAPQAPAQVASRGPAPAPTKPIAPVEKVIKPEVLSTQSVDNKSQAQSVEPSSRRLVVMIAATVLTVVALGLFFIIR